MILSAYVYMEKYNYNSYKDHRGCRNQSETVWVKLLTKARVSGEDLVESTAYHHKQTQIMLI